MENGVATRDFLMGEILAFGVMGRIFYSYPEAEWIVGLMKNDVFQQTPLASGQPDVRRGLELIMDWIEDHTPEEAVDALETDYIRLFVGAGTHVLAPPWESVYTSSEPLLFQQETLDVRNWYARFGLEAVNKAHEPDDHAGLELEFLAHLAGIALNALDEADSSGFRDAIAGQRAFLTEHVLAWIPSWCNHVTAQAVSDFYRGCALVTRGLVLDLAEHLGVQAYGKPYPTSASR
ncbi:dehydrogenase [Limnochorda pilosa]|uniref:Dehydrogenase n=2 Tax=Limnochorda pilosa TaxID=1555112 RepID=A0A0K2SGD3_LIMPI|nr:dehydrogenase [Limnochorda pilosa]